MTFNLTLKRSDTSKLREIRCLANDNLIQEINKKLKNLRKGLLKIFLLKTTLILKYSKI
jgi:hypothetical protein